MEYINTAKINKVTIDKDDDYVGTTLRNYNFFYSHAKLGIDALTLYNHLIFTARLQETNRVKAKDNYLMNGLHLGEQKLKKLKAFLHKHGYISYARSLPDKDHPHLGEVYIQVHFIPNKNLVKEQGLKKPPEAAPEAAFTAEAQGASTGSNSVPVETQQGSFSTPVATNTCCLEGQMLKEINLNALRKKEKEQPDYSSFIPFLTALKKELVKLYPELTTLVLNPKIRSIFFKLDKQALLSKDYLIYVCKELEANRNLKPASFVAALRDGDFAAEYHKHKKKPKAATDSSGPLSSVPFATENIEAILNGFKDLYKTAFHQEH